MLKEALCLENEAVKKDLSDLSLSYEVQSRHSDGSETATGSNTAARVH